LLVFGVTHFAVFPGSLAYFKQVTRGQHILDLKPEFTTAAVYKRLDAFGEEGRQAYLQTMKTIDTIFPLSVFGFLFMFGRLASQKINTNLYARFYWVIPALYLSMDFTENIAIITLISNYPTQLTFISSILGYISVTKRVSMLISLFTPILIVLYCAIKNLVARKNAT